ncbi:MAG: 2-oxo acid dehydrogenase subunit E2, partial [Blastocatellia bacterium]
MRDNREIANIIASDFGANSTYVEDLLRQFQYNPNSVGDEWGQYFHSLLGGDGLSGNGLGGNRAVKAEAQAATASPAPVMAKPAAAPAAKAAPVAETVGANLAERLQIRGPAMKIVENMEASLSVPTATSLRQIQIKLLDENRRWINRHLEEHGRGKTSYTHFIAWAILKTLAKFPQLNDGYEEVEGTAYRIKRTDVNLGVAVDVQKKDGSRTLLVPNIKAADKMTFWQFVRAYQD